MYFQKYWHKISRRELLNKALWRRISYDLRGHLIVRKALATICQWSTKSSRLCEDTKWFISRTRSVSSMKRRKIFQQDNAAIHNASITNKYLLEQKIRHLDNPDCSPDLSPIENLWGLIVAKGYEEGIQSSTISELKNTILNAWEKIPPVQFQKLFVSMPSRTF